VGEGANRGITKLATILGLKLASWPWYQKEAHVEANVEDSIEHESLHHILNQRTSSEVSDQFDNLPYIGSVLEGLHPIQLKFSDFPNCKNAKMAKMPKFKRLTMFNRKMSIGKCSFEANLGIKP
jgi:hypothetical protein